jgi:peptide deformylase
MSILTIAKMGHPVLRRVAAKVHNPTDPEIARLASDMRETLEEIGASGLAAPQVFCEKRVVVYRIGAARIPAGSDLKPVGWTVMVNPEIMPLVQDKVPVWERCLSIPGLHGKVPRYPRISIRYQTTEGATVEHVAHSSWAAILQHECDHLDGILYPMRMEDLSTLAFNEAPGGLAEEVAEHPDQLDPLFVDLVGRWPARERWGRSAA